MKFAFLRSQLALCAVIATLLLTHGPMSAAPITGKNTGEARRIVSIGGAITEILYALGRDTQIVAVDSTSIYPPRAQQEKANVGYMRQLSPEGVLSLRPSLILAVEGSGPKETISVIESSGVPIVSVPDHYSSAGVIEKITTVASAVDAEEKGRCLAAFVQKNFDALKELRPQAAAPAKVMFVLSMAGERLLVSGTGTAADGIIRLAGAQNAVSEYEGYKAINEEAIVRATPEFILVMQRGREAISAEEVFAHPAFKLTPAATKKALVSLDGLYMLGFGPRTASAALDLAKAFSPQRAMPTLATDSDLTNACRE